MSTVNRLKQKKKTIDQPSDTAPQTNSNVYPNYSAEKKSKTYNASNHSEQKQQQYESYYQISQCNPLGVSPTSTLFPHSHQMHTYYNLPLGFLLSPLMFIQNQHAQIMQKSADRIPRCKVCRAYMNCYNKIEKNKFTCFLCTRQTSFDKQYNPKQEPNQELNSSIYQSLGSTTVYPKEPTQEAFVFLVDLNIDSANSRMMYYFVAAMKQVLARQDLDQLIIYFFTYDELIQQYDLSGQEIKCTIIDQSIEDQLNSQLQACCLKDIRNKLFDMLDTLQQRCLQNNRKGSNFTKAFDYVFNALKHTGAKFFIFQSNQLISGQRIFSQESLKTIQNTQAGLNKPQSLFQTKNKTFFDKYINQALLNECSFSLFVFQRNYKNLRVIHDFIKLTNSELKVYSKDSQTDLQKFYYDLYFILGATHYKNVRVQFLISAGWNYTAIYGNFYRTNQFITFQINSLQSSRKILALVTPSASNQYPYSFCSMQVVTNYRYKRQHYMSVSTIVQPVTGYLDRLYASIDPSLCLAALAKGFLSSLRMDPIQPARKKLLQAVGLIYNCALGQFKKSENIPSQIFTIIMGVLAMFKSHHSQPQLINNTPPFDKLLCQRNLLQFCGSIDLSNFFNPYLFDLSNMDQSMCREDLEFAYPPTTQMRFHNVKEGLFLLDNGIALYLFIAKQCPPNLLSEVFGKAKISKNDELNQQLLNAQQTFIGSQIRCLIKFLRQQKSYGWVPLYIVRCGQNTVNQRSFYLHFYQQKYEQFRSYKMNLQQFIAMISKQGTSY